MSCTIAISIYIYGINHIFFQKKFNFFISSLLLTYIDTGGDRKPFKKNQKIFEKNTEKHFWKKIQA